MYDSDFKLRYIHTALICNQLFLDEFDFKIVWRSH